MNVFETANICRYEFSLGKRYKVASKPAQLIKHQTFTKMAVLAAAALLDELMGRNRNIAPNEKAKELNWEDPEVIRTILFHF